MFEVKKKITFLIAKGRRPLSVYHFLKGPSNINKLQLNTLMEQSNGVFGSGQESSHVGCHAEENKNDRDA